MSGCHPTDIKEKSIEERIEDDLLFLAKSFIELDEYHENKRFKDLLKALNSKKESYRKFHCTHCGKSTIISL